MHSESTYNVAELNVEKLVRFLENAVLNVDTFKVTVAEDTSGVYGLHVGVLQDYWFSDAIAGFDILLYISPKKRGSMSGVRMIKAFEAWAFSKGAIEVRPGCTTGVAPEQVRALHERLGYETVGYTFRKVR